jgi:hypothetical protein
MGYISNQYPVGYAMFKAHLDEIHNDGANIDFDGVARVINKLQLSTYPPVTDEDIRQHYRVFISLPRKKRLTNSGHMSNWVQPMSNDPA